MLTRYKLLSLAAAFLAFCLPPSLVAQAKKPVSLESRVAELEARIKAQDEEIQSLHALVLALDARSANQDGQIKNLTTLEMTSGFDLHPDASHYYYWCGGLALAGNLENNTNVHVMGVAILPANDACFVVMDRKYTTAAKSP